MSREWEIEDEIRRKVKGEDVVKAWMEEDIEIEPEGTGLREYIEHLVEKVEDVVPGLEIPSEYTHTAFEAFTDILNDVIHRECHQIGEAGTGDEKEEVRLYECDMPSVGRFYVVRYDADYAPNYTVWRVKITKDRKEAYGDFKDLVQSLPA